MPVPIPVISSNIILTQEPVPAAANTYWYKSVWQKDTSTGTANPWLWNYFKPLEPLLSNKIPPG